MATTLDLSSQPSDRVAVIVETKEKLDLPTLRAQLLGVPGTGDKCKVEKLFPSEDGDFARFAIADWPERQRHIFGNNRTSINDRK